MATLDSKEIPDTPPPITQQELRDHEVMEQLLATNPELQGKNRHDACRYQGCKRI